MRIKGWGFVLTTKAHKVFHKVLHKGLKKTFDYYNYRKYFKWHKYSLI